MATIRVRITNSLKATRTLMIEPWTTEYQLPPGKTLDVIANGDPKYPIEVEIDETYITFVAFDSQGATVSVLDNGTPASPAGSEHQPPHE